MEIHLTAAMDAALRLSERMRRRGDVSLAGAQGRPPIECTGSLIDVNGGYLV
jgi:hypothetical protein